MREAARRSSGRRVRWRASILARPLIGIRVLDAGGTAADACVAMAAAMAVLSPMQTGMGGDAFFLFYEAETGSVSGTMARAGRPGRHPRETAGRDWTRCPSVAGSLSPCPAPSGSGRTR